jgi:hypothetical protein
MKRLVGALVIIVGFFVAGCGSDEAPTNPNNGSGGGGGGTTIFKAKIDGVDWAATSNTVQVTGNTPANPQGTISISGGNITSGIGMGLTLSYISGTGTYAFGVNPGSSAGGVATVSDAPDSWSTPLNGASGSITISTRTATRIAGTFQFTASPVLGGGPDVAVTAGEFDITVSAGLPDLPTGLPSAMHATMGGVFWNGATIVGIAGGASFGGSTTEYSINFVAKVPIVAGGQYDIGADFTVLAMRVGTTDSWAVTVEDSVGYMNFITATSDRVQGFFGGTLPEMGTAAMPLEILGGFFSVGLVTP